MAALPRLETCDLTYNRLGDAAARLLARAPPGRMPRLCALDLTRHPTNLPVSAAAIAYFNARAPAAFPALNLETGVRW